MSEVSSMSDADSNSLQPGDVRGRAQTAGQILKGARERAGLHVAALAVSLKVPVKKLEALEADRLDLLPDAVFVRALASSVCRTLKIDPAPVLTLLPQTAVPKLGTEEYGINAPFHAPGDFKSQSLADLFKKPAAALVFLLL
jgi:cytoskeleton protein RodZ